jgi:hypothetical protein
MSGRRIGLMAGFLMTVAVVGLAAASGLRGTVDRSGTMTGAESLPQIAAPIPQLDLQKDGPFGGGKQVDLSEAESISGFSLPPPPETETTGSLTAIWINESGGQVAYVWESDLRLYISRPEVDPASVAANWEAKASEPDSPFDIVPLSFGDGIGAEASGTNPSSLLSLRNGYEFQFVGPKQSLAQLVELAEGLEVG